jgi:hypothetical protein
LVREAPADTTTSNNIIDIDRVLDMAREFSHVYFRGIDIGDIESLRTA